jgi:hypothetical protein
MIERLIRIGLALAIAFVFTGRMEAATAHCARLAAEEKAVAEPQQDAMPCHSADKSTPAAEQVSHHPASHDPAPSTCECVAVLVGLTTYAPLVASASMEPYEWMRPQAAAFASVEPSPGLRPPRT